MSTHRTVLVIADSDKSNRDYGHHLQQDGSFVYRILTQRYDTQILELSRSQQVDGILLELDSPHSGSFDVLRQLKEQMGERCPPIIVIDSKDAESAVQAFKNGAVDYLVKDRMTPDDLRLAMRSAIENAELRRELQRSQEQFQTSVENMLDCFGIFSSMRDESGQIVDFRIDYLNGAACENNRMPKQMQIGRGLCEVLPAHRESGLFDEYCRLVETGEPLIKDSLIYEDTYSGKRLIRAFDIRATKLNDGFVASWRDVTERKRLELELRQTATNLRQQQNRLQRLIDTAPIGIGIGSANGEVRVINDTMLHLHGLTREEFEQQGMNWRDFAPPEEAERTEQAMAQLRQQGFLPPEEKELLRRDGTQISIWISAMRWMDGTDEHVAFAVDLTQQKQAEAVIQQLNRDLTNRVSELQTLLDIIPVGIAIATDPACTQMQSNAYIRQLLGISPGTNISKSVPADEQPPYQVFQNGQEIPAEDLPMQVAARLGVDVRDTEFEILLPDGTVYQMLAYTTPLRGNLNEIRGAIGAFLDVTERHQAAAALKASQERYRELAEAMPQMVWTADAQGEVNYWNQRWYEYTGLSEAESMGLSGVSTVHPDDRDRTLEQWNQSLAKGEPFEIEHRIRRWDGVYHWFINRGIPTRDERGQIKGWIGTITDIDDAYRQATQRQQTEAALRDSQHFIQQIAETTPGILYVYDLIEQSNIYVNQQVTNLLGYTTKQVQAMGANLLPTLIHPEDFARMPAHIAQFQSARDGEILELEYRMQHANGEWRWFSGREVVFSRTSDGLPQRILGIAQDITEQKQAENALQTSKERFRLVTRAVNGLVFDWNLQTGEVYRSEQLYDLVGVYPEDAPPTAIWWQERIHPDDLTRLQQLKPELFTSLDALYEREYRVRHEDGHWVEVWERGCLIRDDGGQVIRVVGSTVDISDRKLAEAAIAVNEARLQGFVDANVVGILHGDIYGNIHEANDELLRIVGYTREDLRKGRLRWIDITPPEYLPLDEQAIAEARANGACTPYEKEYICKDGSRVPILIGYSLVGEAREESVAFILDLRDRKLAEEALRQSEDRLRMAIESAQLGTWDWNLITNKLTWDEGCKAMFGLPPEAETSIEVFLEGLHPDDALRLKQVVQESLNPASGGSYDVEYRTIGIQDGIERWIAARGQVYFDAAGNPLRFIGTVLDITKQKQAEAEREQLLEQEQAAREAAERANRVKDEFLAILSHELRSPLNPILGWTKLLQTRKFDETKMAQALATIERNAKLQTQLIDDLLDVAKILRGKLNLNTTSVNLSLVIEAAIDTVKAAAVAKSISLHLILPNIGQVLGDAARLQQIVWNLLSNAIKFTPNHGQVNITLERVGDRAEITVTDTGKGINPDFLPHIFESFRQEDASIARKYGGLGLGLAIVRQLVEAHGGTITANSPGEGLGATFTVLLPLLNVEPEIKKLDELPQQALDLTGIRVLAVDDDPDARELLTALLSQYGAEVLTVTCAAQVLANLESFQPDVLVSDIGMPEVDGYTLIRQVRALPPQRGGQIPAIALTAYAREDDRWQAITSGYQRHVTKPLEPEQLVLAVMVLAPH
ncbi:MAG: hypothetical protein Fur006_08860 [Coleofasciculaceae cyanobacterium]